jgi:hypothetical protein
MKGRMPALSLLIAVIIMPALALEAPAQDSKSLSIGTFHSPKGIGLCLEIQQNRDYFDSFDVIADMFGILNGDYSRPGYKATYCRNIILKHFHHDEYKLDLYAGPGVTAGYVRDIHEPMSIVAGLAGSGGCRLFFDNKKLVVYLELGLDLAAEINRNNRYKNIDLDIYKSGIMHVFYPQVRILYNL